jgi:hypothetical protein
MTQKPGPLSLVHRAASPTEAELIRSILEGEGLMVLIPDKNVPLPVDLTPSDGDFRPTGCDVLVPKTDLGRAQSILAEAREAGQLEEEESEDDEDLEDDDDDE